MEEAISNTTNITQVIIDTINSLLNTLFSSIENSVYETLDDLAFISTDILDNTIFQKLFGYHYNNGLLIIANSLLLAVCLYYCFKLVYSHFTGIQIERPYQFVFKLLIFGIFIIIYIIDIISSFHKGVVPSKYQYFRFYSLKKTIYLLILFFFLYI